LLPKSRVGQWRSETRAHYALSLAARQILPQRVAGQVHNSQYNHGSNLSIFSEVRAARVLIEGPKCCGKTWTATAASNSQLFMQDPDRQVSYLKAADTKPSLLLQGETCASDFKESGIESATDQESRREKLVPKRREMLPLYSFRKGVDPSALR
jgi:hypothetical protein